MSTSVEISKLGRAPKLINCWTFVPKGIRSVPRLPQALYSIIYCASLSTPNKATQLYSILYCASLCYLDDFSVLLATTDFDVVFGQLTQALRHEPGHDGLVFLAVADHFDEFLQGMLTYTLTSQNNTMPECRIPNTYNNCSHSCHDSIYSRSWYYFWQSFKVW